MNNFQFTFKAIIMKSLLIIFLSCTYFINSSAQNTRINFKENEKIAWGSLSAQQPSYGFYGQEFEFSKDVELVSFSVYIVQKPDHADETKSTINYSIWSFDAIPKNEIFLSEPVNITQSEINNWKKFQFNTPLKLSKGKYLFGVGQSKIQGFVAFGNGIANDDYHSKLWAKTPMEGYSDGTKWFDFLKAIDYSGQPGVVMMRLEYK